MLDKKECRKFADPGLRMDVGRGLLHAAQISHIVRTAVKIINHRRTLVMYVYDRQEAVQGDFRPVFTVFQTPDDFITLARKEDGGTAWRASAFDDLVDNCFSDDCAFYTPMAGERVCRYFRKAGQDGFRVLNSAQRSIQADRSQERRLAKERRVLARMEGIRALPRGWRDWLRRSVMPAYFLYGYRKGAKAVAGTCSSCGETVTLTGVKNGATAVCPRCGRELTMRSNGRLGFYDRDTVQFIQQVSPDELVVRVIKTYYNYERDGIKRTTYESARLFIRRDPDGSVHVEPYYHANSGTLTKWRRGSRPVYVNYQYFFGADPSGHVYCGNLLDALVGTPWEYCPLQSFYEHFQSPMYAISFLCAYLENPRLEHLVKTGFFRLAAALVDFGDDKHVLDQSQNRTHRILQVAAEDVPFLRELDANMGTLQVFQEYEGLKDRQRLLRWQLDKQVTRDIAFALDYMTVHKFIRYVDGQYARPGQEAGKGLYRNMQAVASEYRDYLEMCTDLDYDMDSSFILYPKDLRGAHDEAARRAKIKADAEMRQNFQTAIAAVRGRFDFEADGMKLLLPATPEDLATEGNALHHCVGSYAKRVAEKECIILFLRRCDDLDKPFYTIEVCGRKVIQVQGMRHRDPTPEVSTFMAKWERQVLYNGAAA